MKKIIALLGSTFTYFCIATVIALLAAASALWFKGVLDKGRMYRVLAALHGLDVITMQQNIAQEVPEEKVDQVSYEERLEALTLNNLDLDMRENAVDNAQREMHDMQTALEVQRERFEKRKDVWDAKVQQYAETQQDEALRTLQQSLEILKPAQAKQQLMKLWEEPDGKKDVITVIKNMAIDKRRKLLNEFKDGPDSQVLYEILDSIRLGEPGASQTQNTQDELDSFSSQ